MFPCTAFLCRRQGIPDIIHTTPDYAAFFKPGKGPLVVTFHNLILDSFMGRYSSFPCELGNVDEFAASIRYVDEVFYEESLEQKEDYLKKYQPDILVMGDDWQGKFDHFRDICEVIYLSRIPSISTTEVIEKIQKPYGSNVDM